MDKDVETNVSGVSQTFFFCDRTEKFQYSQTPRRKLYSRDSVDGIATGYGLDDRGVGVRVPVW
jgi:hypothetical protein